MGLKIFSEKFRDEILKLNLKTTPDVVLGIINLSGSAQYSSYIDSLGKDPLIKNDKASVSLKDPGNIVDDSVLVRQKILNKNLKTPADVISGISDITANQTITNQYLSGRGEDTNINDYNIKNPGNAFDDSKEPREKNLKRNLKTVKEILDNTPYSDINSLGIETKIGDSIVLNPGSIDDSAKVELKKLFGKNKPININDPSENDPLYSFLSQGGYTYTSLLQSIGNLTLINELNIPNAISISLLSNQTPEVSLELQLQQNRYYPVEYNQFESKVISLKTSPFATPYANAYASGIFTYNASQKYEPSSFLNIKTSINPLSIMTDTADPMSYLLNGGLRPLENETLLMNIAALELKFNFEARIKQAIERETIGATNIDEALTNPIAAANIIRNPFGWFNLFEKNYAISVPSTTVGKAAQFAADLAGLTNPINLEFALSTDDDLSPRCFNKSTNNIEDKNRFDKFIDSLLGRSTSRKEDRDRYFLRRTGAGQRYSLFYNVGKNKYQPDYLADSETTAFISDEELQALRKIGGYFGIGSGEAPEGRFYIGSKTKYDDPVYLLQDSEGQQVRSNQSLIEAIKDGRYIEPGYSGSESGYGRSQGVSEYGSLRTNFIWKSKSAKDKAYDFNTNQPAQPVPINIDETNTILSNNNYSSGRFRECSILFTTSQLLDKGIQTNIGNFNSPIDQTITKFYDGYDFMSRANATILPKKIERLNKQGEVIGYRYIVPGLDASGKRDDKQLYDNAELCRVWTKVRPYTKVNDLVRYKELIRKERNSVIDRNGNYNIFPSELNVNEGYGRTGGKATDAKVEFFGERRARKYMFSIENLAWRDYLANTYFGKTDLPSCEKGPNGGRIMWFPPYDIQFTDNTSSNWTTHQFLGRSEPIYTYNNTERTGTLSWKIVVDHPSVLNLITQKELARLTDGEVDELLSAFWAGCLEFDVFELARIWNQFTESDIDYFKKVIGDLDLTKTNEILKPKLEKAIGFKQPVNTTSSDISSDTPKSLINGLNLFFENDVPLSTDFNNNKDNPTAIYDTGNIEAYNIYFEKYYELTRGIDVSNNVENVKNNYRNTAFNPSLMKYDQTIGFNADENYMNDTSKKSPWYGMESQYNQIQKDLSDPKYIGFDLKINIEAHASPLAPDSNNEKYNNELSKRRFISVVKWLITKVMSGGELGKIYYSDNVEVTSENIDDRLTIEYNKTDLSSLTFRRDRGLNSEVKDDITFLLKYATGITPNQAIKSITPNPLIANASANKDIYFLVNAPEENSSTKVQYCCFESEEIANKAVAENWLPDFTSDRIGTISAKRGRPYKDIVCGALSIYSSYARRVTLDLTISKKPEVKSPTEVIEDNTFLLSSTDQPLNDRNVTKRDIAQRIINKMITECDYFELLKSDTPFLYDSLKQKFKHFQPAFHAITPEGLNSRLTFLQQCLRPGETIKRKFGEDFCDANNTAFGKPPICVLRIGDFYNTKIIIDSLNISYEPLVWDLNPEGIGAQPMIANINLSFKYLGGSGLRKYVDELQNALTFNYYANADIYDDRTFANKDEFERDLINLERDFFNNNTLDLIPIVSAAERISSPDFQEDIPYGTLGVITKRRKQTTAGGSYSTDLLTAKVYDENIVYNPYEVVSFNGKYYLRKSDNERNPSNNSLNGSQAEPGNTKYWEEIPWRNYGEQAFHLEFSTVSDNKVDKTYYNWYETHYMDLYKNMYDSYANIITKDMLFNKISNKESLLLNLLLNKNYNKPLNTNQTSGTTVNLLDFNNIPFQNNTIDNITGDTSGLIDDKYALFNVYKSEAIERGYVEYGKLNQLSRNVSSNISNLKLNPIKLHLYPQNYLYKIGDGKTLISPTGVFLDNDRFNPGNFTGGYENNVEVNSEIAGLYLKDFTNKSENMRQLFNLLSNEMDVKIKLDLAHFWWYDNQNIKPYENYIEYLDNTQRDIIRNYISDKLKSYNNSFIFDKINAIDSVEDYTSKFGLLVNGLSVVLDGYDVKKDTNRVYTYEVIPNEYKLSTSAETLFGYDPYFSYKTLSFNNNQIISFKTVIDYVYDVDNSVDDKLRFLSLGNGLYFFKQISKDFSIDQIVGTNYTFDNFIPESLAIRDYSTVTTQDNNFVVTTGITLNSVLNKNGLTGTTTTLSVQPIGSEDKEGSFQKPYRMTYTFEKLNYEFFDFTNKTLDVMLNDNYLNGDFDLDILENVDKSFKNELGRIDLNFQPLSFNDWLSDNPQIVYEPGTEAEVEALYQDYLALNTQQYTLANIIFNGNKTPLSETHLGYYTIINNSTNFNNLYTQLNNFIAYNFIVTDSFIKKSPRPGSTDYIGETIELSGFVDLLFIDFLNNLNDTDKTNIINKINEQPTSVSKNKINSIVDSIFKRIKDYVASFNTIISPLHSAYNTNYDNVVKSINKVLINNETNQTPNTTDIVNNLIKGNTDDYTLVIKDTKSIKQSSLYNYTAFTNNKSIFNIITQSEETEIIEDTGVTTEFNKYLKNN